MATHDQAASRALKRRTRLFDGRFIRQHPAARAFLSPQRDRAPKVQHPKP